MYIYSAERQTGVGARHATQLFYSWMDCGERLSDWVNVSDMPGAEYVERREGFSIHRIARLSGDRFRAYHCSNSGNVKIEHGRMCRGYVNGPVI